MTPRPGLSRKELAAMAGVSEATLSRIINNTGNVSAETRRVVFDVMRHVGYGLAPKDLVGLIIPDDTNPYFADLGFVFQEQLDKLGVYAMIASSQGRPDRELELVNRFKGLGIRGLVYVAAGEPRETVLSSLADENVPVVVFDRLVQAGNLDFVTVNSRTGMFRAIDYLVTLGHERIGHITGLAGTRTAKDRWEAFGDALAVNRLEVAHDWVWRGAYSFSSGRACAEQLLNAPGEPPSAVVAANDAMALGFMQRLQEAGWSVPRDISIVGFDNISVSAWSHPRLTTVEQPVRALVYHAIEFLMERTRHHEARPHDPLPPRLKELEPRLIPRASTAPYVPVQRAGDLQVVPLPVSPSAS